MRAYAVYEIQSFIMTVFNLGN